MAGNGETDHSGELGTQRYNYTKIAINTQCKVDTQFIV